MIETLTRKELRDITGYDWRSKQIEWLRSRRWPHETNAHGYPVVMRSVATKKLGLEEEPSTWEPDWNNLSWKKK